VLARERAKARHVVHHVRLLQEKVELLQADGVALELLAEKGFHEGLATGKAGNLGSRGVDCGSGPQ
jgi:hypothetical protein